MATCTSCGHDVTGKKFCPECGTPVQPTGTGESAPSATSTCPRCSGTVKPGAAFCMHCGSSLSSQVATATAQSQPLTQTCIACRSEVPTGTAFCTNCGQGMQASMAPVATAAPGPAFCTNCGRQNNPGVKFCAGCGSPMTAGTPAPQTSYGQTGPYPQTQPYSQQYGQPPYQQQPYQQQQPYPQQFGQPQYNPQYQQQYGQGGYQPQPMVGQQPMVLRCPTCMAMSPMGTPNCPSCRTSLAGVVPTPSYASMPGQQGGLGNFMQGDGGKYAMGALGGAAAVIGGEMLLHGVERDFERDRYDRRGDGDGLLGGIGDLANDIGLF